MAEGIFESCKLFADARAPSKAREFLALLRFNGIDAKQLQQASLLVSELVTNCVVHAGLSGRDTIDLTLELDQSRLRIEVKDAGHGYDLSSALESKRAGFGYGLRLVQALSDRWGIADGKGLCVWFELEQTACDREESGSGLGSLGEVCATGLPFLTAAQKGSGSGRGL